jgi:hypothetical protein
MGILLVIKPSGATESELDSMLPTANPMSSRGLAQLAANVMLTMTSSDKSPFVNDLASIAIKMLNNFRGRDLENPEWWETTLLRVLVNQRRTSSCR